MTESIFSSQLAANAERQAITQELTAKRRELEAAGKTPKQIQGNKEIIALQGRLEEAKSATGLLTTRESLAILNRGSTESATNKALRQAQNVKTAEVLGLTTTQRKELYNESKPPSFPGGSNNGEWVWTGTSWGWRGINTATEISDGSGNNNIVIPPVTSVVNANVTNPNDVNNNGIPDNLEAAQLTAATQERLYLEQANATKKAAIDLLKETIKSYFTMSGDDLFVDQLSKIIDQYSKEGYDAATISVMLPQTEPYQTRFAGNKARLAAGLSAYSPAEYLQAELEYNEVLRRYDLEELATRENFGAFISNLVSPAEVIDRVVNVYDRIRNADTILKNELETVKELSQGSISEKDFAKALLTGETGANELKRKIATAEIAAEARVRNLGVGSAQQLQQLGVTREQARAGFEQIALTQPRLTQLEEIYTKTTPDASGLQQELEREQFQGLQSQRRRRLAEQETASFMGQSGTGGSQSLGRRRAGSI